MMPEAIPTTPLPPLSPDVLVSVVMPAYNYAPFLREAIDSVLAQTYPYVELVVVDDGSTDETPAILASYGDRLTSVRQPNSGQAAAINRARRMARGELVGYLNADDVLEPGAVAASVEALRARPDAVMSFCDFALIDAASRRFARCTVPGDMDLAGILRTGHSPFGPGSFVRQAADPPLWDTRLSRVPDFENSLQLACLGPFVHVPHVLASFRIHEQSISFAAPLARVTDEAIGVVERFYAEHDLPDDVLALKNLALARAWLTTAQGHVIARRWGRAFRHVARAVMQSPAMLVDRRSYRLLISGAIGQALYRRRARRLPPPGQTPRSGRGD
jgi:glycosyltransferase involved in cell wall biosynthesis